MIKTITTLEKLLLTFRDTVTKWTSSKNILKDRLKLWCDNFNLLMDS